MPEHVLVVIESTQVLEDTLVAAVQAELLQKCPLVSTKVAKAKITAPHKSLVDEMRHSFLKAGKVMEVNPEATLCVYVTPRAITVPYKNQEIDLPILPLVFLRHQGPLLLSAIPQCSDEVLQAVQQTLGERILAAARELLANVPIEPFDQELAEILSRAISDGFDEACVLMNAKTTYRN